GIGEVYPPPISRLGRADGAFLDRAHAAGSGELEDAKRGHRSARKRDGSGLFGGFVERGFELGERLAVAFRPGERDPGFEPLARGLAAFGFEEHLPGHEIHREVVRAPLAEGRERGEGVLELPLLLVFERERVPRERILGARAGHLDQGGESFVHGSPVLGWRGESSRNCAFTRFLPTLAKRATTVGELPGSTDSTTPRPNVAWCTGAPGRSTISGPSQSSATEGTGSSRSTMRVPGASFGFSFQGRSKARNRYASAPPNRGRSDRGAASRSATSAGMSSRKREG